MEKITNLLREKSESKYRDFISSLSPDLPKEYFLGIRVPLLRDIAKKLSCEDKKEFLKELPHKYYEENLLHGFINQTEKDFSTALKNVEDFLPFVNSWAISDTMRPKVFEKHKEELLPFAKKWVSSKETYTIRFGIDMFMSLYLKDNFKREYLDLVCSINSEEYYVNMMIAWYIATALLYQYEATVEILKSDILSKWVQNKAIQKACESYRISPEDKIFLRTLKK